MAQVHGFANTGNISSEGTTAIDSGIQEISSDEWNAMQAKRPSKYHAQPQEEDGYRFASKAELKRYRELKLLERSGKIFALEVHPSWPLTVNGVSIGRYTADFKYFDWEAQKGVVEDVKGTKVRDYILRKKLMLAIYGITITEIAA